MRRWYVVVSLLLGCPQAGPPGPTGEGKTSAGEAGKASAGEAGKASAGQASAGGAGEAGAGGASEPTPAPFVRDDRAAVQTALRAAGVELDAEDCVAWPPSFPRVAVVGSFAHDRGCSTTGVLVDRRWAAGGDAPGGLATRGFVDARGTDKQAIARAWIDEVVHAFGDEFVTAPEPAFGLDGSPAFTPVVVRDNKIGGVVVEGWERVPPGMVDESRFVLKTYRFAPGGALESETRQEFAVDGARLREARARPDAPPRAR